MLERTVRQATFSQWSLQELEKTFHLRRHRTHAALTEWLEFDAEISPAEQARLQSIRELVLDEAAYWSEEELKFKLIAPLIEMADFRNGIKFFAGRVLSAEVDGYELRGIVDGILAAGHYEPEIPYFCLHEFKPEEPTRRNDPAAQVLSAMLAAQARNEREGPVYGAYVLGRLWFFLVLEDHDFAISEDYSSARDQIVDVLRALKSLKQLVKPVTA
jgi:hypothetical protein